MLPSRAAETGQFARRCAERLRGIEARLDYSCGSRWQSQLDTCDDLASVARLLLPLQQRCEALPGADNAWLEKLIVLSPAELAEQCAELTGALTARLDEVERAVPPVRRPADMLGEVVFKQFKGHGTFIGTIMEYDQQTGFRLQYDDGDTEDVGWADLRTMMMPRGTGEAMPPAPRERGQPSKPNQYAHVPSLKRPPSTDATDIHTPAEARPPPGSSNAARSAEAAAAPPLPRHEPTPTEAGGKMLAPKPVSSGPPPGARKKQLLAAMARQRETDAGKEAAAPAAPGEGGSAPAAAPPPPKKQKAAAAVAAQSADTPGVPPKPKPAPPPPADLAQLPPGWVAEARGRNHVYVSPDGLTQFSTLAKVRRTIQSKRKGGKRGDTAGRIGEARGLKAGRSGSQQR
jgi:pyruvate/2-oxoglutarate dehydrogenase complex dihydrolipoamide acyltransferase (E2) component